MARCKPGKLGQIETSPEVFFSRWSFPLDVRRSKKVQSCADTEPDTT